MKRACANCDRKISACNGYVIARTLLQALTSGDVSCVKELCGRCGLLVDRLTTLQRRLFLHLIMQGECIVNRSIAAPKKPRVQRGSAVDLYLCIARKQAAEEADRKRSMNSIDPYIKNFIESTPE